MANIPANPRLWKMLIIQAHAKYHSWPNPAGSAWVHQHYVQMGGKFVSSEKDVDSRLKDKKDPKEEKRDKREKKDKDDKK